MLTVTPIAIVTFFVLVANLVTISIRLRLPYPVSPWEAGIVTDAWRMMQGDPVYTLATDHATHMYGPLVTILLAEIYRLTGPVLLVGRFVSAICGTVLIVLVSRMFSRPGYRLLFAVSAALMISANSRTMNYFTETRPDLSAFLFGTIALMILYRGLEGGENSPRFTLVLLGSALFVIGTLFKQTAAVFTSIPVLAMLGEVGITRKWHRVLVAAIPMMAVLITFGAIWRFAPAVWHFTVTLFAQYKIPVTRLGRVAAELFLSVPVFLLALMHWISTDAANNWYLPRARWLLAAIICTVPVSIIAAAKDGGAPNSLIPALVTLGAFCAWRAPVAFDWLRDARRPLPIRLIMGSLLATAVFLQIYPDPRALSAASFKGGHGVKERVLVIAETRSLPGKVVCPDDPTIPLLAKGYAGRTAVFEADTVYWNFDQSQALIKEINSADYVIVMRHAVTTDGNALVTTAVGLGLTEDLLRANGFEKSAFRTTATPVYVLWRRVPSRAKVGSRSSAL
jgi:hypothetical protein